MNSVMHPSFDHIALAASFASAMLLFAPGVFAEDSTNPPKESHTPAYPNERPSWSQASEEITKESWYGRQVIAPTAGFDVLSIVGLPLLFTGSPVLGGGFIITGMVGRSLSGPIVHLGHGRPLRALASLGLESSGVLVGIGAAYFAGGACPRIVGADVGASCNNSAVFAALIGVPLAVSVSGTLIDSIVLAHDKPDTAKTSARLPFSVSPYVLPFVQRDEKAGSQRVSMQWGLAGQF